MSEIKLKPEAIRANLGMNQEEFCKSLGISVRVYHNRLSGKTGWKAEEVVQMCRLAKIKFEDLDI